MLEICDFQFDFDQLSRAAICDWLARSKATRLTRTSHPRGIAADRVATRASVGCAIISSMRDDLLSRITIEPGKCGGKPCIRGMRIRVSDILELLGAGAPYEEILNDYPFLQREDILAAITYAAQQTNHLVLKTP